MTCKYVCHKLSFGLLFNDATTQIFNLAIKNTLEKLDVKYIMDLLEDVDRMKKVIF